MDHHRGRTGPRTDRSLPLSLFDDDLDFEVKNHDYQQQEGELGHHLVLLVTSRRDYPAGFSILALRCEGTVDKRGLFA
jgi:hypothetical protein